ncbi:MAG: hypothetical protein HAW60_01630 [Bdellovibrionales bacterium]|nr:hypothetical protein [Bdellovibrionales bacterium]
MIKNIFFVLVFLFFKSIYAAPAQVLTETAVYKTNNFDSDIIIYLPANKKVQASKKIYKGKSFGSFRKIKVHKNKYGFVSDVDIKLLTFLKIQKKRLKKRLKQLKTEQLYRQYLYLNTYVGLGLSFNRFTEKNVDKQKKSAPLTAISFQLMGPWIFPTKIPLNISFSYAKMPSYYKKISNTKYASGYVLFGDISYPMILSSFNSLLVYYSAGVSFRFIKGQRGVKGSSGTTDSIKNISKYYFGGLLGIGSLFEFSQNMAVKIDASYNYNGGVFFEGLQTTLLFKY